MTYITRVSAPHGKPTAKQTPKMDDLTHRVTSRVLNPKATPASTIAIKVNRLALRSSVQKGLKKTNWFERNIPFTLRRWVSVEAAEHGTDDSVFFVPEHPNVDNSHERTIPAQYIKVNPAHHDDVVRRGDDFEVSFIGMSVAPLDIAGNNEILLVSLTREENSTLEAETKPDLSTPSDSKDSTIDSVDIEKENRDAVKPQAEAQGAANIENSIAGSLITKRSAMGEADPVTPQVDLADKTMNSKQAKKEEDTKLLNDLPNSLTIQLGDIPFLHYDPEIDGHDTGSAPNSFVPIPGSKRVYLQRRASKAGKSDVSMRFTVMEIDKLSEEQLIAIKSLDSIGKSVGKAAATVPYLKFISWILKFANFLGRSALKKVAEPEHVLSKDMVFLLADPLDDDASDIGNDPGTSRTSTTTTRREEYGNYLRYGYYFFLNTTVDAKLYAQTGASSQSVPLLLRRSGYSAKFAPKNEREFFPMTGVSYVAVKVTRGCSPVNTEQRVEMKNRHKKRLVKLLKKYTGKLENAVGS